MTGPVKSAASPNVSRCTCEEMLRQQHGQTSMPGKSRIGDLGGWRSERPQSALHVEMSLPQHLSLPADCVEKLLLDRMVNR